MGMNRTLLDYLLNRVDEADAREFQRVLAMPVTAAPSEDELNQRFERDLEREKTGEDQRNDLNKKEYERPSGSVIKKTPPKKMEAGLEKLPNYPREILRSPLSKSIKTICLIGSRTSTEATNKRNRISSVKFQSFCSANENRLSR